MSYGITLTIETDNSAFGFGSEKAYESMGFEVARIMREAAGKIENSPHSLTVDSCPGGKVFRGIILRDINGNVVGSVSYGEIS